MTDGEDDYSCVYLGVHALHFVACTGLQVRDSHPIQRVSINHGCISSLHPEQANAIPVYR